MKRILTGGMLVLAFWLTGSLEAEVQAQASFEILAKGASNRHYIAIKGEEITPNEKYFYMFSQLTRYHIVLKKDPAKKAELHLKILDEEGKEVVSNYNAKKKRYFHQIHYKCGKTQRYTVIFEEKPM
jgi:hypothetical protein